MATADIVSRIAEMSGALAVAMLLGLSPRIATVPVVGFKYPDREMKFSLAVAAFLLVFASLFYFYGSDWLSAAEFNMPESLNAAVKLAFAALIASFVAVLMTRYRGQPFRSMGWHAKLTRPALQFSLALVILSLFLQGKFLTLFDGVPGDAVGALLLCLVIALAEESAFRGYIQMRLISAWGLYGGWAAASLIYLAWRLPFLSVYGWGTSLFWTMAGLLVLQSFLLGWIMVKSRHALVPALYNAVSMWVSFL